MRISFDIDDTLVLHQKPMACEQSLLPVWLARRWAEPLRAGTKTLFRKLRTEGHEIWIYTSSLRTPAYIRFWLWLHGIRVAGVVNEDIHRAKLAKIKFASTPSKYPLAFGIDLHVDDSPGVAMEGGQLGFNVLVIAQDDVQWTETVLNHVSHLP